jgi:pyrroloquinoline quinone biosynthesis protein D
MTENTGEIDPQQVPTIANGYRLQFEAAQDLWVLLYPEGMVKLNPSASEILQRCDGKACVADIIEALEKAFDTGGLGKDVYAFLAIAREQHWIILS